MLVLCIRRVGERRDRGKDSSKLEPEVKDREGENGSGPSEQSPNDKAIKISSAWLAN